MLGALLCPGGIADADERNINGTFEQGMAGWSGAGDLTCPQPHSGQYALAVAPNGFSASYVLSQPPLPAGTYAMTGWVRVTAGSATPRVYLSLDFGSAAPAVSQTPLVGVVSSALGYVQFAAQVNTGRSDVAFVKI